MALQGSDERASRLVAGVREGRRTASRQVLDELLARWERHDEDFDTLLDPIVALARSGSEPALELVLTAVHQLGLARPAITRLIVDPDAVSEVAQRTLVKVEANLSRFEARSKFRTWLYTIARNEALMHLRRDKGTSQQWDHDLDGDPTPGPRLSTVVASRATLRQAIDTLPEPYRATILLRVDDDLGYDQIAASLGVPIGTVRSRLAKARELLSGSLLPG